MGPPYVRNSNCFSLVILSIVNLIIKPAKKLRKVDGKFFPSSPTVCYLSLKREARE